LFTCSASFTVDVEINGAAYYECQKQGDTINKKEKQDRVEGTNARRGVIACHRMVGLKFERILVADSKVPKLLNYARG
jgi:hypothetical protein